VDSALYHRPPSLPKPRVSRRAAFFAYLLGVTVALLLIAITVLWATGRLRPYSVPSNGMAPAIQRGDLIIAEGVTYLFRKPRRGEALIFKTNNIAVMWPAEQGKTYVKRLAGLPGEVVRITDGHLFINDALVVLSNEAGEIKYVNSPGGKYLQTGEDSVTVPPGHYFVLGDKSADSADSRYWGFVPAADVRSRAFFRYGPISRIGPVR